MIRLGTKENTLIYLGSKAISAGYKGVVLIWQAVRSCFGSGHWVGKKPWIGKEGWKYSKK